ncbi:MAG TPA: Na+/H+ antiporter NhaA, partial [Chitinophagales bacterium]|nr:Na+/H+ antiporter NhaA [Chitinophagales bacterium]
TIYTFFNFNNPETAHGWGVPMATDIAFALAVLLLAGDRVPFMLKLMLTSLAVVDDLGAIVVIALFYTESLQLNYLLAAGAITLFLSLMNYAGVKRFVWYLVPGILLWYFIFQSGVHATIAGVVFAMTIPHNKENSTESTLLNVVHSIHIPVNFFILPIFAFNNTLITFTPEMFRDLASPMALGISLGLILGKPIGITLFVWLAIKTGISTLGNNIGIKHIFSVSILGGIGFTMSIFISLLAFKDADMINAAKLAILISSILAAVIGLIMVKSALTTTTSEHK